MGKIIVLLFLVIIITFICAIDLLHIDIVIKSLKGKRDEKRD